MTSESTSNNNMTTAMETLVGTKLLTKVGTPLKETKKIMEGKDLALLYFSASWCPVSIILFYCFGRVVLGSSPSPRASRRVSRHALSLFPLLFVLVSVGIYIYIYIVRTMHYGSSRSF